MDDLYTLAERERLERYLEQRRAAERLLSGAAATQALVEIDEVEALLDRPARSVRVLARLRSWADAVAHRACDRLSAGDLPAAQEAAETYRLLDMLWQAR